MNSILAPDFHENINSTNDTLIESKLPSKLLGTQKFVDTVIITAPNSKRKLNGSNKIRQRGIAFSAIPDLQQRLGYGEKNGTEN